MGCNIKCKSERKGKERKKEFSIFLAVPYLQVSLSVAYQSAVNPRQPRKETHMSRTEAPLSSSFAESLARFVGSRRRKQKTRTQATVKKKKSQPRNESQ